MFFERMIKRSPSFIKSDEPAWGSWVWRLLLYASCATNKISQTHCSRFLVILFVPSIYCCGLASTQPCLEIYRRLGDLCIRQHPLQQPLLTALCKAKLNQMCAWRLIFTTPSHFASISMLCGAFKSRFGSVLFMCNYIKKSSAIKIDK